MYANPSTTSVSYLIQLGIYLEVMLAYQFNAVHFEVFLALEVLDDVPLIHPLGYKA